MSTISRKAFLLQDEQVVKLPDNMYGKGLANRHLIARCASCFNEVDIVISCYWKLRKLGPWTCYECRKPELKAKAQANPLYKNEAYKDRFRKLHDDPVYTAAVHNDVVNATIAESTKEAWKDPTKRANHLAHRQTEEFKERIRKWSKAQWDDQEYRANQITVRTKLDYRIAASERAKELWQDPVYREKIVSLHQDPIFRVRILEILDKNRCLTFPRKISKLQEKLYCVLEDLDVVYFKEGLDTIVGPFRTDEDRLSGYAFDALAIKNGLKLYIECNGEWWHKDRANKDIAKADFLATYMPGGQILTLWEDEFRDLKTVRELITARLQSPKCFDFELSDISLSSDNKWVDVRNFFSRYHYLGNAGRSGSRVQTARIGDLIVAAAIFAEPTRSESAKRLGLVSGDLLELTRFAIHSEYHKKNFASWFLSRAIKSVWNTTKAKMLIAFSDLSQGHLGTIYRALGWQLDGEVDRDYFYQDQNGKRLHKKTVWNRAVSLGLTESQYRDREKLNKVFGNRKLRFTLERP